MPDDDPQLSEAINRLASVAEGQLAEQRHVRREAERLDPERVAEFTARKRPLRRLSAISFMKGITGFADQFIPVPEEYVKSTVGMATIACPCGTETNAENGSLTKCEGCERIFLHAARITYVGNSPKNPTGEEVAVPV